jgi:hypothetical protein
METLHFLMFDLALMEDELEEDMIIENSIDLTSCQNEILL